METLLIKEKQDLQKRLNEATAKLQYYSTLAMQLEGAILHCDEMLKKIKDDSKTDSKAGSEAGSK